MGVLVDKERTRRPQSHTKNDKKLRNARSERNSLSKGRAHQFVIKYQMASSGNIHTSNIIQTDLIVFTYIGVYVYV